MRDRDTETGLRDEVIDISVHTKVTKGGRNLRFSALVAVGDGAGKVGLGYGKARGVPMAIEKATKAAKANIVEVPLVGDTVAHEQIGVYKAAKVLIRPAVAGTGVKAGGTVRAIMNVLGVHSVLTKSLGRNNPINLAKATMNALEQMSSVLKVQQLRGRPVRIRHPQWSAAQKQQQSSSAEAPEQGREPGLSQGPHGEA